MMNIESAGRTAAGINPRIAARIACNYPMQCLLFKCHGSSDAGARVAATARSSDAVNTRLP
eukprot:jgi/Psemu1/311593/fgenesh1_kg.794_\